MFAIRQFRAECWGRIPNFFSDLTWTWLETVLVKFKLSQVLGWSSKL